MNDPLTLDEMLESQRKLQAHYLDKWGGLSPEKGRDQLLWMMIEAGEAADVIKKWGDEYILRDPEQRANFIEELCDVLMYLGDVMLCYDITPEEMAEIYRKKFQRNMHRWD